MSNQPTMPAFVTNGEEFLVQIPSNNQWGFDLHDDDQTWPGGFGLGAGWRQWHAVSPEDVPTEDRERLEWLLDH